MASAIILKISHGYDVEDNDDPYVDLADRALVHFCAATAPAPSSSTSYLPVSRFLPRLIAEPAHPLLLHQQ